MTLNLIDVLDLCPDLVIRTEGLLLLDSERIQPVNAVCAGPGKARSDTGRQTDKEDNKRYR